MPMVIVWRATADGPEFLTLRAAGAHDDQDWAWRPPSGGIENGETYRDCATRELWEETGLELDIEPLARAGYPTFVAQAPRETSIVLSVEHDAFAWVDAEELVRRTRPSFVADGVRWALIDSGLVDRPILGGETTKDFGGQRFRLRFFFTTQTPPLDKVTAAIGLPFAGDRLLLVEHATYGGLQPAGGHLEAGETPVEALRREVLEEAAADIADPLLIGYQEIELLGEAPDGYRYPIPSYQLFYTARIAQLRRFTANDEASGRRLLGPEEAAASTWAQQVPGVYEHALAMAHGSYGTPDNLEVIRSDDS